MRRILSLGGGGIKGAATAAYLAHLEQAADRPIAECFDLIAGTSTGGIIASLTHNIARRIWISLAVITLAALAIMVATTLIIRWHNQNRM